MLSQHWQCFHSECNGYILTNRSAKEQANVNETLAIRQNWEDQFSGLLSTQKAIYNYMHTQEIKQNLKKPRF
jgi:hypothetical protein